MSKKRNKQRQPTIGGVVGEDTTKQARVRRARKQAAEMTDVVKKGLKLPTPKETADVLKSKER